MNYISIMFILFLNYMKISGYLYNKSVKTPFTHSENLTSFLETPCFFDSYLSIINAENITYDPIIENKFSYPQKLSYNFLPKIPNIPSFLISKQRINHTWLKNNLTLNGLIESNYANFNISVYPNKTNDDIFMTINGTVNKKNPLIPNNLVTLLMDQFCDIFLYILK